MRSPFRPVKNLRTDGLPLVRNAYVALSFVVMSAFAVVAALGSNDGEDLCGGRRNELAAADGGSPSIELRADGVSGPFLLDYGATRSSLSASAFPNSGGAVRRVALSLPGFTAGDFDLRRYETRGSKAQKQLGVIGTDVLSLLSVQLTGGSVYLGSGPCPAKALRARGLSPVAQKGFFSSDPSTVDAGRPNVPVVFLRLGDVVASAQIDTGYDDAVYPHSVDINQPLYDRLVESGIKLERTAATKVLTCEGPETRPVYSVNHATLVIEDESTRPIVRTENFSLIVKTKNGCGGIAGMTAPAAQLGASFLRLFGTAVFDPKSGVVWLMLGRDAKPAP